MKAHERQEVILKTEPGWSFDHEGPHYSLSFDGSWARNEKVDPAPCYTHDVEAVRAELAHLQRVAPVPVPLGIFVLSHEMLGRTNAWCLADRVYTKPGSGESYPIGIIAMSGKRIPIHPAMTRYLVAHEYGHFVENWLTRVRDLKDGQLRTQYLEQVRPDASRNYGCSKWHQNVGEIFANDFRILIAKREPEFWPHPGVARPEDNLAAIGWWEKVRQESWSELPDPNCYKAVEAA
jgi:hypothetical protein